MYGWIGGCSWKLIWSLKFFHLWFELHFEANFLRSRPQTILWPKRVNLSWSSDNFLFDTPLLRILGTCIREKEMRWCQCYGSMKNFICLKFHEILSLKSDNMRRWANYILPLMNINILYNGCLCNINKHKLCFIWPFYIDSFEKCVNLTNFAAFDRHKPQKVWIENWSSEKCDRYTGKI